MTATKASRLARGLRRALFIVGGLVAFAIAALVGLSLWLKSHPPKPSYRLTVVNRGNVAISYGYLSGDSLWRPVGGIRSGQAFANGFAGSAGRPDSDFRLHLVRADSSRVTVKVGWITGEWDASSVSHDAVVIESDASRTAVLVYPMERQNQLMAELGKKHLIDSRP